MSVSDLFLIYTIYIRSILKFNCCVGNFSLPQAEVEDEMQVYNVAFKIILKVSYSIYHDAIFTMKLDNLKERRRKLSIKFAHKHEKLKGKFPFNENNHLTARGNEKFHVNLLLLAASFTLLSPRCRGSLTKQTSRHFYANFNIILLTVNY